MQKKGLLEIVEQVKKLSKPEDMIPLLKKAKEKYSKEALLDLVEKDAEFAEQLSKVGEYILSKKQEEKEEEQT